MMLEPHDLRAELVSFFQPKALRGKRVLITAGRTSEKIDPVRVITNRSSGKMGYAIAQAARAAGAQVVLVSGHTALPAPYQVLRVDVESGAQMHAAVMNEARDADIRIAGAAAADCRVVNARDNKLTKQDDGPAPTLDLEDT